MTKWSALAQKITGAFSSRSDRSLPPVSKTPSQPEPLLECPRSLTPLKDALGIYPNSETDIALRDPTKARLHQGLCELAYQMLNADFWRDKGDVEKAHASQRAAVALFETKIAHHVMPDESHYHFSDEHTGLSMVLIGRIAPFFVRHNNEKAAVAIGTLSTGLLQQSGLPSVEFAWHATRWHQFVGTLRQEENIVQAISSMEAFGNRNFDESIIKAKKNAGLPTDISTRCVGVHKGNLFALNS